MHHATNLRVKVLKTNKIEYYEKDKTISYFIIGCMSLLLFQGQ